MNCLTIDEIKERANSLAFTMYKKNKRDALKQKSRKKWDKFYLVIRVKLIAMRTKKAFRAKRMKRESIKKKNDLMASLSGSKKSNPKSQIIDRHMHSR